MFIKSEKHPSPPFTRNYLTHKTLNKKVKGEGLKTLFLYIRAAREKWKGTLGSKIGKTLKKEYNIRFKIYPSPFTSSPQHISIIVFPTDAKEVKEEYNIKVTDDPKVLEKEYQIVVIGTQHKMFDSIDMNNLITDKGFMCDIYGIHKPRN